MKRALVTGAAGQDGFYLTRLLLEKEYMVYAVARRPVQDIAHDRLRFVDGDVRDERLMTRLLHDEAIDEIYNLAGSSFGPASWDSPVETAEVHGLVVARLLEAIRSSGREIRLFQAASSELFGHAVESPQNERTPFHPLTPYAVAKQYAFEMVEIYRRRYGVFACNGILFNHESPLRRPEFVTRKVTLGAARIAAGLESTLRLKNLSARRDWGFAGDFAEAMWRMLQHDVPEDFVVATGVSHSVRELCEIAFARMGLDYREHVIEDPDLFQREEFDRLGDAHKLRETLGWRLRVTFREMIEMMTDADAKRLHGVAE